MKKYGIMLSEIAFSNMPVLFANAGLDFFLLDYEHGGFDYGDMAKIISTARLCHVAAIVRLPNNGRKDIVKLADMGADGFLLPMTNCAEDVATVVRYAKYRPVGERGISTMRAHTGYNPPEILSYVREANRRMKIYAQIETRAGVERVGEILSVPGVDGCFVGPNDLSDDYGCLGKGAADEILSALDRVGEEAARAGKTAGVITSNKTYLARAAGKGYTMFSVGSELNAIAEYCKKIASFGQN
ncbi:MAG: HpcH/HpaI aldolase/citrate lyase family protein [Candidatus Gallimonas sp.]